MKKIVYKCHLLQVDSAMVYSCEYQNKVQSALWPFQTVNLFTAATYDTNRKEKLFLTVTDSQDKVKIMPLPFQCSLWMK